MPTYEFRCNKCRKVLTVSWSISEYERKRKRIKCEKCKSSNMSQRISAFQVQTSKKS